MNLKRTIKQCIKGDNNSYKKLYEYYASLFLGICKRYANSEIEADDMLQESFINIFNNLTQLKKPDAFEAWARRIVVNTSLKFIKERNNFTIGIDESRLELSEDESKSSLEIMSNIDIINLIKLMDYLPMGYRTILNLYAVEGYSHKDIAEILDIREVTSRTQYFKAKKAFQKILLEETQIFE
ncbi:MAG: sigma-70 family RNA polymerase sigma factor [Marinifilaceae bacterium]|jgi:RNA polymerase sigma-70 factor (ECF subfamily)|nr:sigma-70 family RNA polymerase sigma factor [Marinifilaceae bacterium]